MRYGLRTLLIVLALGPLVLASAWHGWCEYRQSQIVAWEAVDLTDVYRPIAALDADAPIDIVL